MERLAPLIISMTIAAIASSPDAENLARSEASVEPVNFFARDKTILELSRSRQRGEEGGGGGSKKGRQMNSVLQGNRYPRLPRKRARNETAF